MTHPLPRILILAMLAAVLIVSAPALADDTQTIPITMIVNEVVIHADDDVRQIGYTVNGKANLPQVIVPAGEVEIRLNTVPDGNAFKVVYQIGNSEPTESRTNPASVTIPPTSNAIRIDVYLSLAAPLPKPQGDGGSGSQGSSVISTEPATIADDIRGTVHGVYTNSVENGGNADFPETQSVFCVIMPEGYTGDVVLTTYTNIYSSGETDIYHLCDISITGDLPDGTHALVQFKIPLSVLESNGYSPADACLYHHGVNGWTKCPTTYEVRGGIVYYEATVSEFSPFIIVFEKNGATPKGETPTGTEPAKSPLSVACVLAGLAAVVLLCRRR